MFDPGNYEENLGERSLKSRAVTEVLGYRVCDATLICERQVKQPIEVPKPLTIIRKTFL